MTRTTSKSGQRFYTWGQDRFWSVTTIIGGGVPKPALLPWGIKSVAEGAVEAHQRGSLAPMIEQDPKAAVSFLKGLPYANRDRAAKLGTEIHAAAEAAMLGKPTPPVGPDAAPYMGHFHQWVEDMSVKVEQSEASVFSRAQAYAGTLDMIAVIGGRRLIVDHKTGKGVYPEVALQLAAYRHAEFIGRPDGREEPMPAVDGGAVLHLTPTGYRFLEVECGDHVYKSFLYAKEVFRWMQDTSKTVIGDTISEGAGRVAMTNAEALALFGEAA